MADMVSEELWLSTNGFEPQDLFNFAESEVANSTYLNIVENYATIIQDEETRDVALVGDQGLLVPTPCLVAPTGPPARGNFAGELNFEVQVNGADTNKKKYLYSHLLNRIYVDMKVEFPVQFRWDWTAARPLVVRATTAFAETSQSEKRVQRCLQHVHPGNDTEADPARWHVLHSSRPRGSHGVVYTGEPSVPQSWYSVCVTMTRPAPGADQLVHAYSFQCKSSCSSGINRRPIEVIFTLEETDGRVLGRQSVSARVCSCPKRDLEKDERSAPLPPGKRRRKDLPPGKRVKTEQLDDVPVFNLPPIVGLKNYRLVLEVMANSMKASALTTADEAALDTLYRHIDACQAALVAARDRED